MRAHILAHSDLKKMMSMTAGEEVVFEAQRMSSTLLENDNETMAEYTMASSIEDGRFAFHLNLPDGLGLQGAGIVDGKPELRFGASPNTPRITEEDVAAAMRLAREGERPEFYYIAIPRGHPFFGRQFKQYKPQWMRGTSFGETFSEADWKMKCLHIGAKSNETKSQFWARQKTSKLEGLATRFDFRDTQSHGSIIMSCNLVKVQKSDNELLFEGEPRMRINDESNMRYSKYISKNFRAVAYYDEPLFLKMQELFKLVLIAEWLVEKGVKVDEEWMMNRTQPTITSNQQVAVKAIEDGGSSCDYVQEPPSEMIPQLINFQPPNRNVTVKTKEAELNRSVMKQGVRRRYGWYDRGHNEGVMFDQDGTLYQQQRSLKMVFEHSESVNGKLTEKAPALRLSLPLPFNVPIPTMSEFGESLTQIWPSQSVHHDFTNALGQMSADFNVENIVSERGIQLKGTRVFQPSSPLTSPLIKETDTVKISVDDFDTLYSGMDPNQAIWPEIPGKQEAVIPNVSSWCELYNETVPWPYTWQTPYIGVGEPVASGGVSGRYIPVREEAVKPRKVVSETVWKDNFKRRDQQLVVRGVNVTAQAVFTRLTGEEFYRAAGKFTSAWQKGAPPQVHHIFSVENRSLEIKWSTYRRGLSSQIIEEHFHGTSLSCDISTSRSPCRDGNCGVCGISCSGLDPNCIRKNIDFQRFGHGFYVAPHSSKCHDYTQGINGYRAMLLCDVCPGNKHRLETNSQHFTGPPRGYDSVYGQVGSKLNYPELVVYNPEAVLPRLIFIYQKDGTAHPLSS